MDLREQLVREMSASDAPPMDVVADAATSGIRGAMACLLGGARPPTRRGRVGRAITAANVAAMVPHRSRRARRWPPPPLRPGHPDDEALVRAYGNNRMCRRAGSSC
jgi:hypothetical protein